MRLTIIAIARTICAVALMAFFASASFAADRIPITVEFTRAGNDMRVSFKLAHSVSKFTFAYIPAADRDQTWVLSTPGLKFANRDVVSSGGSFDHFDILVHPGVETSEIAYPSVTALGPDSVLIYPGYFIANREAYDTTLKFNLASGEIVAGLPTNTNSWTVPPLFPRSPVSASRYVYVGPRAQVQDAVGSFVFAAGFPDWMKSEVVRTLHTVIPFYEHQLGRRLPQQSAAYAVLFPTKTEETAEFRADVTDDFMVLLRFWGPSWSQPNPEQLGLIHEIVSHEAFHFWNGSLFYPSEGEVNPWLHEGSASYMSWVAQAALFGVDPDALRQHMEDRLNSCVEALGGSYLVGALHAHGWGSATYDCGEVAQWLSDVGVRKATHGGQNIFSLWSKLFQVAEQHNGAYSTADYLSLVRTFDPDTRAALGLFLVQEGRDRWAKIPALFAPLGVKVTVGEAPERRLRETMMWHLLRTNCEIGLYGFWAKEGGMLMQTGEGCGALAGNPTIVSIEGHNLFTDTRQAYSAEWDRCKAGAALNVGQKNGASLRVPCGEPMEEPLPSFKLESDGLPK